MLPSSLSEVTTVIYGVSVLSYPGNEHGGSTFSVHGEAKRGTDEILGRNFLELKVGLVVTRTFDDSLSMSIP